MEKYFDLHSADFTIRCKKYFAGKNDVDGINMENAVGPGPVFKHVVLFCHGFAGHKDNAMANKLADRILERHDDTALVIFNWPGHGDDEHAGITLADCDAYLGAVLQYIQKELRPENLGFFAAILKKVSSMYSSARLKLPVMPQRYRITPSL